MTNAETTKTRELLDSVIDASTRRDGRIQLSTVYVVILAGVTFFCAATHFVSKSIVRQQADNAEVVNISGKQRMLSQRIALLATIALRQQSEAIWWEFEATVDEFELANDHLAHLDQLPETVKQVYFSGPYHLDRKVREFIDIARAALATRTPAAVDRLRVASLGARGKEPDLLHSLDAAVSAFEAEHDSEISSLKEAAKWTFALLLGLIAVEACLIVLPIFRQNKRLRRLLEYSVMTEPLTGALSRYGFEITAQRFVLSRKPCAVLMLDVDGFKKINDQFGHETGDRCLKEIVTRCKRELRAEDIIGRIGGDEFVIMLFDIDDEMAQRVAERTRASISEIRAENDMSTGGNITVSIGLVSLPGSTDEELTSVLKVADEAVYDAKRSGRNRVVTRVISAASA